MIANNLMIANKIYNTLYIYVVKIYINLYDLMTFKTGEEWQLFQTGPNQPYPLYIAMDRHHH